MNESETGLIIRQTILEICCLIFAFIIMAALIGGIVVVGEWLTGTPIY